MYQDPGKKAVTSKEPGPDLPARIGLSPAEVVVGQLWLSAVTRHSGGSGEYSLV